MKSKITLTLILTLSMLVSLASFASSTQGQVRKKPVADTAVVTPSSTQILRITVVGTGGNDMIKVRFGWMKYMAAGCNNEGVCGHTVVSQGITLPVGLPDDLAVSFDVQGGNGVRVMVFSNSPDVRVNAMLIDAVTGNITSILWRHDSGPIN